MVIFLLKLCRQVTFMYTNKPSHIIVKSLCDTISTENFLSFQMGFTLTIITVDIITIDGQWRSITCKHNARWAIKASAVYHSYLKTYSVNKTHLLKPEISAGLWWVMEPHLKIFLLKLCRQATFLYTNKPSHIIVKSLCDTISIENFLSFQIAIASDGDNIYSSYCECEPHF